MGVTASVRTDPGTPTHPTAPLADVAAARHAPGRAPVAAVAAGMVSTIEALALLALGLTGLNGLMVAPTRSSGLLVAVVLVVLAGWLVLVAAAGATLVDGAGRRMLVVVASLEVAVLGASFVVGLVGPADLLVLGGGLPAPALVLLALSVPITKLLLATTPAVDAWLAVGGRPPAAVRSAPMPPARRRLQLVTVGAIGVALTAVALLGPTAAPAPGTATTSEVTGR